MAGRVHDLINAENFAKWAEERERIECNSYYRSQGCAVAQFLTAIGFRAVCMAGPFYRVDGTAYTAPAWMYEVAMRFDLFTERRGPVLAKIARDARNREPVREAV